MTSLLGRMVRLFSGPRRVEDLFTEAVARLFEREPRLCIAWLEEEGLVPPRLGTEGKEGHPPVALASQKWLGSLGQQDGASRADLQIEVQRSTPDDSEEGGVVTDVVLMESKIGSREGKEQLRRYAEHLQNMRGYRSKTLLYITRGYEPKQPGEVGPDVGDVRFEQRRWRDFYRFLQGADKDALVDEVMTFMEEQGMGQDYRFSAEDLIALSGMPRALDIIEETIDAELKEELARFAGNGVKRAPANLMRRIRSEDGYFVYASMGPQEEFECYLGYAMRNPDGHPRLLIGLYDGLRGARSESARAAFETISRLEGWELDQENTDAHELWREVHLASLLGEDDHVAAVKGFFSESIRQLREELAAFKKDNPELPWEGS